VWEGLGSDILLAARPHAHTHTHTHTHAHTHTHIGVVIFVRTLSDGIHS